MSRAGHLIMSLERVYFIFHADFVIAIVMPLSESMLFLHDNCSKECMQLF